MKLYTYIVVHDTGLAPNPFGHWCSVAVCTPNHQGICAGAGDWICGFTPKALGHRLVYALVVEERLDLDRYFHDARFAYKKPSRHTPQGRCGDNFYERLPDGSWKQHWNFFHATTRDMAKDTRKPIAFVGRGFWYFGANAVEVPETGLRVGGRGTHAAHPAGAVDRFAGWLQRHHRQGCHGLPMHHARAGAGSTRPARPPE